MANENWKKAKEIFAEALRRKSAERSQFLDEVCAEDVEIRREVESLLDSFDDAQSFMESPVVGEVADVITQGRPSIQGKYFGHYEILESIGTGGMGEVYRAKDKKLDRFVAVKILNEKFSRYESNIERFIKEAKAASALNHPNILVIHEIGETEDSNYIVSEFIEGKTLREKLVTATLKTSEILDISIQISKALIAAHTANIVHRDIKPENIIVRPDGFVKILDFGLAKLVEQKAIDFEDSEGKQNETAPGLILGTVNYMSPEQAKGAKIDNRSDIFSLGVVIYEMIAGKMPFAGDSISETFANLINSEPQPLENYSLNVPEELKRIVIKTLGKNRDDRYQTAKDLLFDLKDLQKRLNFETELIRIDKNSPKKGSETKTEQLPAVQSLQSVHSIAVLPVSNTLKAEPGAVDLMNSQGFSTKESSPGEASKLTTKLKFRDTLIFKFYNNRKKIFISSVIICLMALIAFGYFRLSLGTVSLSNNGKKSLAILPFINAGQDPNVEYLSDGITESIINNLSQLSGLKVMSRNSAFRFKNNQTDTQKIALQLGVETLVTGDIKQLGDKLIINVRLINAGDDSQIWGNQYVKTSSNLLAAQNEIAQAIATNLRIKLTNSEQQQLNKHGTENVEAYQLYLRGHFHVFKLTPPEIQQGISNFQQAIEIDPNYALAYVGLADAYRSLAVGSDMRPTEFFPKSKAAAKKAIEIDDTLSDAHTALGMTLFWGEWDWEEAENQYKRALELNPDDVNSHIFYAHFLSRVCYEL
ncbi:MAG TPA: protein kinase [Pyrinomonadaceae bacterium]|nr:protein kinase [Pyrinomonadaceae bacterium]